MVLSEESQSIVSGLAGLSRIEFKKSCAIAVESNAMVKADKKGHEGF
jgi:hypothetical protein